MPIWQPAAPELPQARMAAPRRAERIPDIARPAQRQLVGKLRLSSLQIRGLRGVSPL